MIVKNNEGRIMLCEVNNNIKDKLKMIKIRKLNSEKTAVNLCEA